MKKRPDSLLRSLLEVKHRTFVEYVEKKEPDKFQKEFETDLRKKIINNCNVFFKLFEQSLKVSEAFEVEVKEIGLLDCNNQLITVLAVKVIDNAFADNVFLTRKDDAMLEDISEGVVLIKEYEGMLVEGGLEEFDNEVLRQINDFVGVRMMFFLNYVFQLFVDKKEPPLPVFEKSVIKATEESIIEAIENFSNFGRLCRSYFRKDESCLNCHNVLQLFKQLPELAKTIIAKVWTKEFINQKNPEDATAETIMHNFFRTFDQNDEVLKLLEILLKNGGDIFATNNMRQSCLKVYLQREDIDPQIAIAVLEKTLATSLDRIQIIKIKVMYENYLIRPYPKLEEKVREIFSEAISARPESSLKQCENASSVGGFDAKPLDAEKFEASGKEP